MGIVLGVQLDKHSEGTCGIMALHYLGYLGKLLHHGIVHASLLQSDANVRACIVSETGWIDVVSATHYHIHVYEPLHALVNGGTAHTALGGNILERYAGVV